MTAECIAPIQGTLARIMRLDECGLPVEGAGSLIVFEGFVQVTPSPQYEDGTVYRKRNAQGVNCVNRKAPDQFERDQLTIEFCAIDPDAVVITTGQELIATGAPATGVGFWVKEGPVTARWSLEVWQADSDTCTGTELRYAYWVWPNLAAGRLNDITIGDVALEWSITASSEKANVGWAPPGVSPVPLPPPATAHRGFVITRQDPPDITSECGASDLVLA